MDHLTPQQRHKNMSAIHNKDTKPENKPNETKPNVQGVRMAYNNHT